MSLSKKAVAVPAAITERVIGIARADDVRSLLAEHPEVLEDKGLRTRIWELDAVQDDPEMMAYVVYRIPQKTAYQKSWKALCAKSPSDARDVLLQSRPEMRAALRPEDVEPIREMLSPSAHNLLQRGWGMESAEMERVVALEVIAA